MSKFRCFDTVNDRSFPKSSSDRTIETRDKVIYKNVSDLALNGVQTKKTGGKYYGPIYVDGDPSGCLLAAHSHAELLSVTKGKYLCDPPPGDIFVNYSMAEGNLMVTNYGEKVVDTSFNAGNYNQIIPPSTISPGDANYPGVVVDPSGTYFFAPCKDIPFMKNVDISNMTHLSTPAPLGSDISSNLYKEMIKKETYRGFKYPSRFQFK